MHGRNKADCGCLAALLETVTVRRDSRGTVGQRRLDHNTPWRGRPWGQEPRGVGTDLSKNAGCGDGCARFPATFAWLGATFVIDAVNSTLARRSKAGETVSHPGGFHVAALESPVLYTFIRELIIP
jgi:hypothetical protein